MCYGSLRLLKNPFFCILFNFATSFALDVSGCESKIIFSCLEKSRVLSCAAEVLACVTSHVVINS